MENYYLILVIILFVLAFSDLIVGVSNDAVNFLNSAIGSKVAPLKVIFIVASLGILVGATFSSGMMEVARKGIFHPEMFAFSEIMIIFLSVMITDVILLDVFNTLGLPTSTTVSLVFELLGSSVGVSLIKIHQGGEAAGTLSQYINSEKALAIISGILISVVIAFIVGAIIQYITRIVFSFRLNKTLKYFGTVFGGLCISAMTYFMIIKGIKGVTFIPPETIDYIMNHIGKILLYSFVGWTIILQLLWWLFKINIPKVIVLVGTFGLAMAFAGNDLVNFVGVPVAGFQSFKAWVSAGAMNPDSFTMTMLQGKMPAPTLILISAGIIMIITLITSKKAKKVIATTVDLSRQNNEGNDERFMSSAFSRALVRNSLTISKGVNKIIPNRVIKFLDSRFYQPEQSPSDKSKDRPAFDTIRASINLIISGILISIGTSYKLPLSTTYVTFMVAMGTSLSDRAWGRESAVYRISGVFAVIGGWFMTALSAFVIASVIATIISLCGTFMIFVFVAFAAFLILRTQSIFNKNNNDKKIDEDEKVLGTDNNEEIIKKIKKQVTDSLLIINQIYTMGINGFLEENRSLMKDVQKKKNIYNAKSKKMKNKLPDVIQTLRQQDSSDNTEHYYVVLVNCLRGISNSLDYIIQPMYEHIENNHKPFVLSQKQELNEFLNQITAFFNSSLEVLKTGESEKVITLIQLKNDLSNCLAVMEKNQIKRIKKKEVNTRNALLFFNTITETKNFLINYINLCKSQRHFFPQKKLQDKI